MQLEVTAYNIGATNSYNVRLEQAPEVCPRCHRSIHPFACYYAKLAERSLCQGIFRCTHSSCQELFVATYTASGNSGGKEVYRLASVAPLAPRAPSIPPEVAHLSPTFVEIYGQVAHAEASKLAQLVGVGLRKALEFLVKDFASHQNPPAVEAIKKAPLAQSIREYIADANVRACAERATWLGNDETHYTRKWEDKDIKDLYLLVKLTVNWIENVLLTEKYMNEMAAGKK